MTIELRNILHAILQMIQDLSCMVGPKGDKWIEARLKDLYDQAQYIKDNL